MPTSLLKRILGRSVGQSPAPDSPQTICGTLAPGERIDIGPLRAVNDGGYLAVRHLCQDSMLRWVFSGSAEVEVCISNLGNRPDEGVIFDRFSNDTWTFVAKVRPEHLVVFRPIPEKQVGRRKAEGGSEDKETSGDALSSALSVPLVRTGPGGEFCRDWPAQDEGEALTSAFRLPPSDLAVDQASGLRAAVAGRARQ